jgi:uroporphyrin-III C-methyltransferase
MFPIFLKLAGRPCLVVGAGAIATPKIDSLLRAGAQVTVVAPQANNAVAQLAQSGILHWLPREFAEADLDGVFLVITATGYRSVNHAVAESARARGVLCNSVDDPPDCDFFYPSVVRRGDLQIAVSTAGKSPALAQKLREEIDALLAPDAGEWLDQLGETRLRLLAAYPAGPERTPALHLLAQREHCKPSDCPVQQKLDQLPVPRPASAVAGSQPGKAYLVGAGPGSVDLLTLRAHALISSATCLLHDDLVSEDILSLAAPHALVRNVGKRCGTKQITQEEINAWMIEYARSGHIVVRLKSGDPLLFGRAAEEIDALTAAAIPFEIVPGVSAGFAAAAVAGLPLTGRITSSRVLFATRHLAAGQTSGLADIPPSASLVLYMPGKDYAAIQSELAANGWPLDTQCLAVSRLGSSSRQIASCALSELSHLVPLPSPVVLLFFAGRSAPPPALQTTP